MNWSVQLNNWKGIWGMTKIFLTVLLSTMLASCAQDIAPTDLEKVNNMCASNGGVSFVAVTPDSVKPFCANGARFSFVKKPV